jgi:hypothetical protein
VDDTARTVLIGGMVCVESAYITAHTIQELLLVSSLLLLLLLLLLPLPANTVGTTTLALVQAMVSYPSRSGGAKGQGVLRAIFIVLIGGHEMQRARVGRDGHPRIVAVQDHGVALTYRTCRRSGCRCSIGIAVVVQGKRPRDSRQIRAAAAAAAAAAVIDRIWCFGLSRTNTEIPNHQDYPQ